MNKLTGPVFEKRVSQINAQIRNLKEGIDRLSPKEADEPMDFKTCMEFVTMQLEISAFIFEAMGNIQAQVDELTALVGVQNNA